IISYAVSSIHLSFSSPLDQSSVSNTSVLLVGPDGAILSPGSHLGALSPTDFDLTFPTQNTVGYYELGIPAGLKDIFGVTLSQPYQGSFVILPPVISGHVMDTNNLPVPYVTLSTYGEFPPVLTDTNGAYSLEVLPSWTGTVTPAKDGWLFVPRSRSFSN